MKIIQERMYMTEITVKRIKEEFQYLDVIKVPLPLNCETGALLSLDYTAESALQPYGLGVALYFKYLEQKYLIYLFVLLFILNIPALFIAIFNQPYTSSYYYVTGFQSFLFATTLGHLGNSEGVCGASSAVTDPNLFSVMTLQCPYGMRITEFAGIAYKNAAYCEILNNDFDNFVSPDYNNCSNHMLDLSGAMGLCYHQSECTLQLRTSLINQQCLLNTTPLNSSIPLGQYVAAYAICEDFEIQFPYLHNVDKKDIYYLFIYIDIICILLFSIAYGMVSYAENTEIEKYQLQNISPEKYTFVISGFGAVLNLYKFQSELINHFKRNFIELIDVDVLDMNIVYPDNQYIDLRTKIGDKIEKLNGLEFLIERSHQNGDQNYDLLKQLYDKHYANKKKLEKYQKQLTNFELNTLVKIKEVYITMNNPHTVSSIIDQFDEVLFKRIIGKDKKETWRYFQGRRIKVKRANAPTNLQWKNLGMSKQVATWRRIIVKILSFIVIFASFYWMMYLKIQNNYILQLLNPVECRIQYTSDDVAINWGDKTILKCYCESLFNGTQGEEIQNSENFRWNFTKFSCNQPNLPSYDPYVVYQTSSVCYDYFTTVQSATSGWMKFFIQYGFNYLLVTMNLVISTVVWLMSFLMRRPTLSSELKESAIAMFFVQITNYGLLMFLASLDSIRKIWDYYTPPSSTLFKAMCQNYAVSFEGTYIFDVKWFLQNGTALIFTFFMGAFTYNTISGAIWAYTHLMRWYDRGFTSDLTKTRKLMQADYNDVYKGPLLALDSSYSTMLTYIFVCMMYGSGLPMLYLVGALAFLILFWVDKYLSLRLYCTPARIDHKFVYKVRGMMPWVILLHLMFSILVFGSVGIAPPDASNFSLYLADYIKNNEPVNIEDGQITVIENFLNDITTFYKNSVDLHYTELFGWATVLLFFFLVLRTFLWSPMKDIVVKISGDKWKQRFRRSQSIVDDNFIEIIDDYYLKEKIRIMKRQKQLTQMPDYYREIFNDMLDTYIREYKLRKVDNKRKRPIKGCPFYSLEFVDEFRKKFGVDYIPRLDKGDRLALMEQSLRDFQQRFLSFSLCKFFDSFFYQLIYC